jgi:hypothetical protein
MKGSVLQPYLLQLLKLPFVQAADVDEGHASDRGADARIVVRTPKGSRKLLVQLKKTHLSYELVERVVHQVGDAAGSWLLMAPHIGQPMGQHLAERGINYIDLSGNCHVVLGDAYIASVAGRKPQAAQGPQSKGMRTPGYQVLFALLADPALMQAPVRELAEAAGVSRQPAANVRGWLLDRGLAVRRGKRFAWSPPRMREALDLWIAGYVTSVRPKLLLGTYRTRDKSESARRRRIAPVLREACDWRWGGETAGYLLTRHYKGSRTVVHVLEPPADLAERLQAVRSRDGDLVLLRAPGPTSMLGAKADTAHPLLVYTEMMATDDERVREAAQEVLTSFSALR